MGKMGKKVIMTVSTIVAIIFIVWVAALSGPGNAVPALVTRDVKVLRVERRDISSVVSAPGIVQAVNGKDIFPSQALKVRKLFVKRGDSVKAGERLLEYDTDQLKAQYDQLVSSKNVQAVMLEKLKSTDGSKSTYELETALDQAADAVNTAWTESSRLRDDFDSLLTLYTEKKISRSALDASAAALKQAETAVKNSERAYEAAAANLKDVEKYNEELGKNKEADIKIQQENIHALDIQIAEAKKVLEDVEKSELSPLGGIVTEVDAVEGAPVSMQYPVMAVADTGELEISIKIKEFDAASVKPGQRATVTGDSLDNAQLVGTVKEVSPVAKTDVTPTGEETTVEAVVGIDGPADCLLPGMNVTCNIVAAEKKDAMVVSYVAVKDEKDGSKGVFLVDGKGTIREIPVKLGISSDIDVEVVAGLEQGDLVVTNWEPSFKTGDRAKISE